MVWPKHLVNLGPLLVLDADAGECLLSRMRRSERDVFGRVVVLFTQAEKEVRLLQDGFQGLLVVEHT